MSDQERNVSEPPVNVCTMCKQPEGPDRLGNFFNAISKSGMRLINFWVCNPCAIPLGVGQGPIDPDLEQELAEAFPD